LKSTLVHIDATTHTVTDPTSVARAAEPAARVGAGGVGIAAVWQRAFVDVSTGHTIAAEAIVANTEAAAAAVGAGRVRITNGVPD